MKSRGRKIADCRFCRRPVFAADAAVPVLGGGEGEIAHEGCAPLPHVAAVPVVPAPAPVARVVRADPPKLDSLEYAVSESLKDLQLSERDRSTAELARRYARLIDDAQPAAKYRQHLTAMHRALDMLATLEPLAAGEAAEHFAKIADALAAHSVASDLGPKLLAALTALGMTPASRSATKGGDQGEPRTVEPKPETPFERARRERNERRAREHGA